MKKKILLITLAIIAVIISGCGSNETVEKTVTATVIAKDSYGNYTSMSAHKLFYKLNNGMIILANPSLIELGKKYRFDLWKFEKYIDNDNKWDDYGWNVASVYYIEE